jgi:CubicO group peptidase (beta-lactamase class C family)
MLSMTSGLDCSGSGRGNFLQAMEQSPHWAEFALSRVEVAQPGSSFNYCAGNMQVVSAVLTRQLGQSAAEFAQNALFGPLGITHVSWAKDRDGNSHGFSDLRMQPRDMAKLGYLWLHRGVWEGRQIVPSEYLVAALAPHANVEPGVQYGYGMWIYPQRGHAGGPPDFEANGVGGQRIAVVPGQDMVVVITGAGLDANRVASLISGAVRSDRALPANAPANDLLNTRVAEAAGRNERHFASAHPRHQSGGVVRTAALSPP